MSTVAINYVYPTQIVYTPRCSKSREASLSPTKSASRSQSRASVSRSQSRNQSSTARARPQRQSRNLSRQNSEKNGFRWVAQKDYCSPFVGGWWLVVADMMYI